MTELFGAAPKVSDPSDHVGVQNELRSHLMKAGKPAFVDESFLSFAEARRLVLELGGIPSYPVLADGATPICEFESDPDKLIERVQQRGVHAVEWIPVRNKRTSSSEYVTKMRAAGLAVTAGTEHNTLDLIPFDPSCKDGEVPPEIRASVLGGCVRRRGASVPVAPRRMWIRRFQRTPESRLPIGRRADPIDGQTRRCRDPAVL